MEKIAVHRINPGGNTTALIEGSFTKAKRIRIALSVLKADQEIEQVGFFVHDEKSQITKLQMAGDEFCANAVRSLAFLMYKKNTNKKPRILCSGFSTIIETQVSAKKSIIYVGLDTIQIGKKNNEEHIVEFPGILHHVTINSKDLSVLEKPHIKKNQSQAIGYINIKSLPTKNQYSIDPKVWVRETDTFYNETACGSGSIAGALALGIQKKKSVIGIHQPSGSIFTVFLKNKNTIALAGPIYNYKKKDFVIL